jgi:hypothetical protein
MRFAPASMGDAAARAVDLDRAEQLIAELEGALS